jgi:predicted P-loop ATPase/GTPase
MAGKKYRKNSIPQGKKSQPAKPDVLEEKVDRARKERADRGLVPIKKDDEVVILESRQPKKWWQFWK